MHVLTRKRPLRGLSIAAALVLAPACAPKGKKVAPDTIVPESVAYIRTSGAETPLTSAGVLLGTDRASVRLQMSEPGQIFYTRDGSVPAEGNPNMGVGGQTVALTLTGDVELRYFAQDLAGNLEPIVHQTHVSFDHVSPEATVVPYPHGGSVYPGPIVVHIESSEPATIYYTLDGRLPVPEGSTTVSVPNAVDIPLAHSTQVWFRVLDAAANQYGPVLLTYKIDDVAPATRAEPPGGQFLHPLEVRLFSDDTEATTRFTLDGSEPTVDSPVWSSPLTVATTTTLKFRGVDQGGNLEAVHTETYDVGALPARTATPAGDAEHVDMAGELALVAAVLETAGRAAGQTDRPELDPLSAELWAAGVTAADALLVQSHGGYSGLYSPMNTGRAHSAAGAPDRDGNGSNLEETLQTRLAALASAAGDVLPASAYPLALPFLGANALLLRDPGTDRRADGLPDFEDDYALLTWQGSAGPDRSVSAESLHAGLRALADRALAGTIADHAAGDSVYASTVSPVVGVRCAGCHVAGDALPRLDTPGAVQALVDVANPEQSRLLAFLARDEAHPSIPVTAEERSLVLAWIADGAPLPAGPETAPGVTPRQGFLSGLALEQANWSLDWAGRSLGCDVTRMHLDALGSNGVRYVPSLVRATEQAGQAGMPRVPEHFSMLDARFELGPQARGVLAALTLLRVETLRPGLAARFGQLADAPAITARDYVRNLVPQLLSRTYKEIDGTLRGAFSPETGPSDDVTAEALADALTALVLAQAAGLVEDGDVATRLGQIRAELEASLRRDDGWVRTSAKLGASPDFGTRAELGPQMAVLRALLVLAAQGDPDAASTARQLWGRLDGVWDAAAGAWQTSFGDRVYVYTPALAARVLDTLDAALRAGLPGATERLVAFDRAVVLNGLRESETWLGGEVSTGFDDDRDGVSKPGDVPVGVGVAPAFRREIRFE